MSGARTTGSRERTTARELLLGLQVAMSVVLVSAALLFVLTVRNLSTLELGFTRNDILVANVFLLNEEYPPAARAAVLRDLTERFAAIPGIAGVAHGSTPPFAGATWGIVARAAGPAGEIKEEANRNQVSAGYFAVMGTRMIEGRDFAAEDTTTSPMVAIVNQTFARRFFGNNNPIGQRYMDGEQQFEVIGLVRDTKLHLMREEFRPITYTAASQVAEPGLTIRYVIRIADRSGPDDGGRATGAGRILTIRRGSLRDDEHDGE